MSYPLFHPRSNEPIPLALTAEDLRREFPEETDYVEFKQGLSEQKVQEAMVAFSNTDGGVILLGIRDDGSPTGHRLTGEAKARLHRIARNAHDIGRYDLFELDVGRKPVTAVAVDRRREGFAQTSGGLVLVRRGAMNVPLIGRELTEFMLKRAMSRFELTPVDLDWEQASGMLTRKLMDAWGWRGPDVIDRLEERGLVARAGGRSHKLTVAGVLLLTPQPHENLGKAFVEVFRYRDQSPNYDKRIAITGPATDQVEATTQTIMDEIGSDLVVLGVHRYDLPRLPEVVVREAVANAVAHRNYEMTGTAVRVELRPDAVRIVSPGSLPEPVTVNNIREQNAARNINLIDSLRRFRLAEDAGRGVDVMQDTMQAELLDEPIFEDTGFSVVVTLPLHSAVTPQERAWIREVERRGEIRPGDALLLVSAARGKVLTNAVARKLLAEDSVVARARLQRLCDAGFLVRHGQRAGSQYVLGAGLTPPAGFRLDPSELESVVLEAAGRGPIDNAQIRERTGLERHQVAGLLNRMVSEGKLERIGARRGTRYILPGED